VVAAVRLIADTTGMQIEWWPALVLVGEFGLKLLAIGWVILRRQPHSASTLAWIILILAVPLFGVVAYLMVGEVRLGQIRRRRHLRVEQEFDHPPHYDEMGRTPVPVNIEPDLRHLAQLAETVGGSRPFGGNNITLLGATEDYVQSLVRDIDAAQHHCHLLFYIMLDDEAGRTVGEALLRAAQRGVACRVLLDAVGSREFLNGDRCRLMCEHGINVVGALPASFLRMMFRRVDLRNHRKIVVVDGHIGYVGSHNLADESFAPKARFAPWVDASARLTGPAVRELQRMFLTDWSLDTHESCIELLDTIPDAHDDGMTAQVLATGPNADNQAMRLLTQSALLHAEDELIVTTPYFVPDEATASAFCSAAQRGIDTHLIVPRRNDSPLVAAASRSFYQPLLQSGVQIHEFTAGLLHAKTVTIDRKLAIMTTANIDRRSFDLNFEASLVVYDTDFASQLRFLQLSYREQAQPINARQWQARAWPARLWQNAIGTLSPLL
jgi:cardiolipin synthase